MPAENNKLKPPFDKDLEALFAVNPSADVLPESIPELRRIQNEVATLEGTLNGGKLPFHHHERVVEGPHGGVPVSIFTPKSATAPSPTNRNKNGNGTSIIKRRPAILFFHSGGMICGNRFTFLKDPLLWASATDSLVVTVEYRQSPEHPFPVPHDDCWAALVWLAGNAASLGVDRGKVLVAGQSAGGNLAASLALRARDHNRAVMGRAKTGGGVNIRDQEEVKICGLVIDAGMLDDRMNSPAIHQYDRQGTWLRGSNYTAWDAYLDGDFETARAHKKRGSASVPAYAAPARAEDLTGLPPTFVCVGSAEGFRDENIEFASRMYTHGGGDVELHVWPGGYHCFDMLLPDVAVSKRAVEARLRWVRDLLGGSKQDAAKAKL